MIHSALVSRPYTSREIGARSNPNKKSGPRMNSTWGRYEKSAAVGEATAVSS